MMTIATLQISGAVTALVLQLVATFLTKPIRHIIPKKLWWTIFGLNFLELFRRILVLCSVTSLLGQSTYDMVSILIGLGVSMTLLVIMWQLSRPTKQLERHLDLLAHETLLKTREFKAEDSLAYKLANHFIETRHTTGKPS